MSPWQVKPSEGSLLSPWQLKLEVHGPMNVVDSKCPPQQASQQLAQPTVMLQWSHCGLEHTCEL